MSKEKQPKDPAEQGKEIKTAADLIQDEHNYRKHSEQNKARIKKSIDEAGLGRSVVIDADGVLVAGNGVQSVIDGDTPVKVVETDGTELVVVKRTDLHTGDPRRKTLALADNATADDVEWDFEAIAEDWSQDEAEGWGVEWPKDEEAEQLEAQEDDFDETVDKVETVCKKGDIWKLGNHRLMCGDSTDAGSVALLMDGEKADITITSPPYNAGYLGIPGQEKTKKKYLNSEDTKTNSEYADFLIKNISLLLANSHEIFYNIGLVSGSKVAVATILYKFREQLKDIIYWMKSNPVNAIASGVISSSTELVLCFGENSTRAFRHTDFGKGGYFLGVITGPVASSNEYAKIHKATFPIYLPSEIIGKFSFEGDLVLDCFGGTGTTLIAAEQLGRKCFMMELDPHYCDVIIARWEKFTGNKAEKVNVGS